MSKLTSYSASAGSGKTYTLAREFIELALKGDDDNFRHLLAITFTRKATKEMKSRIVKELSLLATNPNNSSIAHELTKVLDISLDELKTKASSVLGKILVDYTAFKVKTIDSFFEEIVRNFASEIGFSMRYKVDVDDEIRLHQATLLLLSKISEHGKFSSSYNRIRSLINQEVNEGGRYRITSAVEKIGKKLFTENNIDDENPLPTEREIEETKCAFENYLQRYKEVVKPRVKSKEKIFFASIASLLEQLTLLGTLYDIELMFTELGHETNSILLQSSQTFIKKIIANSDTPFIYERVGTAINHYLIDEFQDTSQLQYTNLKPLLMDSLDAGNSNLVVGDVKQSIYKFRYCDRTIMRDLLKHDFGEKYTLKSLEKNWRSAPEIVAFNNALYKLLPTVVTSEVQIIIDKGLDNHRQRDKQSVGAISETDFFEIENLAQSIENDFGDSAQQIAVRTSKKGGVELVRYSKNETVEDILPEKIVDLVKAKCYALGDIAILCFRNSEITTIASALLRYAQRFPEYGQYVRFTGSEALRITNSDLVGFIVDLLRTLNSKVDSNYYRLASFRYERLKKQEGEILPFSDLVTLLRENTKHLSLYELVEQIVRLCPALLVDEEMAYLLMFLDIVFSFTKDEAADLYSFLFWWDERGYKSDLPSENERNAITLMTLHKAKGLEFPIVLLPFPTWGLGFTSTQEQLLRVEVPNLFANETGCSIRAAYVKQTRDLEKTVFIKPYYQEFVSTIIDRLNLFYVATTRAEVGMMLFLPEVEKDDDEKDNNSSNKKKDKAKSLGIKMPLDALLQRVIDGTETKHGLPWCDIPINIAMQKVEQASELQKPAYGISNFYKLFSEDDGKLTIRLSAHDKFYDDRAVKHGLMMHEMMSQIQRTTDLPKAIEQYLPVGVASNEERESITRLLTNVLQNPIIAPLFNDDDGKTLIFPEQNILLPKEVHFSRPDRIVILPNGKVVILDYKFGLEKRTHHKQVKWYCSLIEQMGYALVEAYLLYLCNDDYKLVRVQ